MEKKNQYNIIELICNRKKFIKYLLNKKKA